MVFTIKPHLIIIELLFTGFYIYSQEYFPPTYYCAVSQNGLNLREKPTQASPTLAKIPFGTDIDDNSQPTIPDSINGFIGFWYPVSYKGYNGYVWSRYLGHIVIPKDTSINTDIRIMQEGAFCNSDLNYMPDLHWYGIYKTNHSYLTRFDHLSILL